MLYSGGLVPVDHVPSTVEHSRTLKMEISMSFRNIVTKPNKIPVCIMKTAGICFQFAFFSGRFRLSGSVFNVDEDYLRLKEALVKHFL